MAICSTDAVAVSVSILSHGLHSPSCLSAWWKRPVCSAPQGVERGAYRYSPQRWPVQSVSRGVTRISGCRWVVLVKVNQRRMLVDFKSSQPGCCKWHRLRRATEVSNCFHALPPRPNGLMEPGYTRLPAQTTRLSPHPLQRMLYSD
jgi:hypothetical protein